MARILEAAGKLNSFGSFRAGAAFSSEKNSLADSGPGPRS
jgi:hypothetical protein